MVTDDDVFLHAQRSLVEPDVDDLPVAASTGMEDGHQERARPEDRRPRLGQWDGHRNRRTIGESRRELHAGERLRDAVVAALTGQRPGLTEWRNAQNGEAPVLRAERGRGQPDCFEPAGAEVFDDRVGRSEQLREPGLPGQLGQLGDDRVLAAVLRLEVERVFAADARPAPPERRSVARLDLDDRRAQVGE